MKTIVENPQRPNSLIIRQNPPHDHRFFNKTLSCQAMCQSCWPDYQCCNSSHYSTRIGASSVWGFQLSLQLFCTSREFPGYGYIRFFLYKIIAETKGFRACFVLPSICVSGVFFLDHICGMYPCNRFLHHFLARPEAFLYLSCGSMGNPFLAR